MFIKDKRFLVCYYGDFISINALQCCCVADDTMSITFIFMYSIESQMTYVFFRSSH